MAHKDNPYQDKQGNPKPGELSLFLNWERDMELQRRKDLPAKEVEQLEEAEQHLADKMNS